MRKIYLDHTATTPLDPEVFDAMRPYFFEKFGNASSIHRFGQESKAALDESRDTIAGILGAQPGEIFFVSGGTEADNTLVKGAAWSMRHMSGKDHIITSKIEHHAVLETCKSLEEDRVAVTYVDAGADGHVPPENVLSAIRSSTGIISIMHANNEVGTINAIETIGHYARERNILFHTDAVQTFCKLPIDVAGMNIDLLSISAHKIYGPKGIGAMFIRKGVSIDRLMHGGAQERGRRAGTENVPLVVGFAKAALLMYRSREVTNKRLSGLKNKLYSMLKERFPFIVFNGHPSDSLPHILNVSFDSSKIRIDGESLLFNLDLAGIAVTSGSACTSGSQEPSHVLLAMGRNASTAKASIRFSMGNATTEEDIDYTVSELEKIIGRIGTVLK